MKRIIPWFAILVVGILGVVQCPPCMAETSAFEQYLLVLPLTPQNQAAQRNAAFGDAFREGFSLAALWIPSVVFLKYDEVENVSRRYSLSPKSPVRPEKLERIADEIDMGLLAGSYTQVDQKVKLILYVIQGRNQPLQTLECQGSLQGLKALFQQSLEKTLTQLNITIPEDRTAALSQIPGTNSWPAFQHFCLALTILRPNPENPDLCRKAIPELDQALRSDSKMAPALALRAQCRMVLSATLKANAPGLRQAQADITHAQKLNPKHPFVSAAQVQWAFKHKDYARAQAVAEAHLKDYPTDYANHLLLAKIYKNLNQPQAAEKILVQALEQQGTEWQKKPFQKELGLLLLKFNDSDAEKYLHEVLLLEPKNARLHFYRAGALARLKRFPEAMQEIEMAESRRSWPALQQLKAQTALLLGHVHFEKEDFDRAFAYISMSLNIRPQHFESMLLMAKVLRKKGYHEKAIKQLEMAQKVARSTHPHDHVDLGTEFVALGQKNMAAREYEQFVRLRPKAPESRHLRGLIRKLNNNEDL